MVSPAPKTTAVRAPLIRLAPPTRTLRQTAVAKSNYQAALLCDVQDDMASLLSSVMRRQAGRRTGADMPDASPEAPPLPAPAHAETVSRLRALLTGQQPQWRMAINLLRGLFPDPAEQALLLAGLRNDPTLAEDIRAQIGAALAELTAQHGDALADAANLGRVVSQFSQSTGLSPESLRTAYRTLIHARAGERELYVFLIETFGFSLRGLALDFLEQAVAADLGAAHPAQAPEAFQSLLALLLQMRLLRCADSIMLAAIRRQRHAKRGRRDGNKEAAVSDRLMEEGLVTLLLAALSDVAQGQRQYTLFLQRLGNFTERDVLRTIARSILRAMARIPCELFPDLASRQSLLSGLYGTYDQLFASSRVAAYHPQRYV